MNARSIVQDARRYVTTLLEVTSVLALQASIWILTTTPAMVADNNELLHNGSCLSPTTYLQISMSVLLVMEDVSKTVTTLLAHMTVAVMLDSSWEMTIMLVLVSRAYIHKAQYAHLIRINNIMHTDVDECTVNNGNCDQDCHNTYGSYYCTCGSGWRLDPDGHTCNGYIF